MREQGLAARIRRRHPHTTVREPAHPVADNVLNREFQASAPNERWVGDITYISTQEGWLYLAVILDLYSRRCVGWAMGEHPDEQLAEAALRQALVGRQPPRGLLHHTDRGSTYTSAAYRRLVAESGMIASMSRTGNCWDNAVAESFFSTLKTECIHRTGFHSRHQAQSVIFEYVEVFYNRQRLHSSLGYLSPVEFEQQAFFP